MARIWALLMDSRLRYEQQPMSEDSASVQSIAGSQVDELSRMAEPLRRL